MSNNRRGDSYGDRDIYVSFPKTDSTWTKPLNLGKNINTKGTESAPFLAADDKTLYYTSDGLMGYGGSDIYISRRLDDSWTNWSKPENLGPIVNTAFDESYLTLNAAGTRVYFTSEITDDNDMDIYKLVLPASFKPSPVMLLRGQVIDTKTNLFIPNAKIYFDNLTTLSVAGIARSSPDSGNFQIILPSGSNYGYLAEKQGYISVHSNIDLTNLTLYKEYRQNIYLTPIEVGQTIIFHNIFFDFDKYDLKKASFLELDRLAGTLKNSTTLKIEISGNTDNVGTPAYNDKLSINRAMSVVNYLLAQSGVDKSRITMKHYGETNPVATNTTEAGRQLNRRVQFKILAK
jgi:outer membrane protein OmpA-like peptidoglycan-associated protein